jgi:hypothetical protein
MFKFLRRLFAILTLVSLLAWGGVAVHLVRAQYRDVPPIGWPPDYGACLQKWSKTVLDAEKAAQIANRCAEYYALLGDRDTPLLKRLQQQVQGRLTESVVNAYLLLGEAPEPGQAVTPSMIINALGTQRIMHLFYRTIFEAGDPPSMNRRLQGRCVLEETRRADRALHPDYITQLCMRTR